GWTTADKHRQRLDPRRCHRRLHPDRATQGEDDHPRSSASAMSDCIWHEQPWAAAFAIGPTRICSPRRRLPMESGARIDSQKPTYQYQSLEKSRAALQRTDRLAAVCREWKRVCDLNYAAIFF